MLFYQMFFPSHTTTTWLVRLLGKFIQKKENIVYPVPKFFYHFIYDFIILGNKGYYSNTTKSLYFQGCQEGEDPFLKVPNPWSAFHSDDYGYTRMNIMNGTHIYLEQFSDDKV